jgi:DNA-binding transcriptional regulator YiaG
MERPIVTPTGKKTPTSKRSKKNMPATTTIDRATVDKVRAMMRRHDLNQSDAGRLLGVGQSNVNNWLTGTRGPVQAVARVVALLELMEAFAPSLFTSEVRCAKLSK